MADSKFKTKSKFSHDVDAVKTIVVDPAPKGRKDLMSPPKDGSPSDATSCISSGDASSSAKEIEVDQEALTTDHAMSYYSYYYPGFNGSFGEWEDQYYVLGSDGSNVQHPAAHPDSGSVLYYKPSFQHGYASALPPGAVVGVDGQYFTQQPYYASQIFQQALLSPGYYPQVGAYGNEMLPLYQWDSPASFTDMLQGNVLDDPASLTNKSNLSSQSNNISASKNCPPEKPGTIQNKGSPLASDLPSVTNNQNRRTTNKMGVASSKSYLHSNKFPLQYNQVKGGLEYQNPTCGKDAGFGWAGPEKVKPRSKVHGAGNFTLLNEQNKGPRTDGSNALASCLDLGDSLPSEGSDKVIALVQKEQYNLPDFPTTYDHALFFVIKSYSEDDIHKSIKYNVWSSTQNGNRRLDSAFQLVQQKITETGNKCPVFLFFSVNASGQFCGVAEIIGRVNFNKNMDFWQQDKWTGFFPVKWHIIKDVPNSQFRHIVLENNENKPVTNSRDTQEVQFRQGTEMLNIFRSYSSKTSILDDFGFYENRQKAMQAKKIKSSISNVPRADEVRQEKKQDDLKFKAASSESFESAVVQAEKLVDAISLKG